MGIEIFNQSSGGESMSCEECVEDTIVNGVTDKAPSQNAVFDALALKQDASGTAAAAKAAAVADAINNGTTDVAPSQNAVFDALATKAASSHTHLKADITDLNLSSLVTGRTLYAGDYGTLQLAVDAAELLAGSAMADQRGVTILIPPGDYSSQSVLIKKNVTLLGMGRRISAYIGTVTYRPTSALLTPKFCGLQNLGITNLNAINETAAASGVFNTEFMHAEAFNCELGIVTFNRVKTFVFESCQVLNTSTYTYCENVTFINCRTSIVDWKADDSAANLPDTYSGGNLQFIGGRIARVKLTKDGGSVTVYFASYNTNIEVIERTGESDIRVHGGVIESVSDTGSNNNPIEYNAFAPYNPVTPADWDAVPNRVELALDELAARVKALEP